MTPTVYLLCGLVGSGKTTYARRLEREGVVRLSLDELVFDRHGEHGVDYPEELYPEYADAARAELDRRLADLLATGRSVVLDYGFWSRAGRERYKALVERDGATWRLLYFEADEDLLRARLARRRARCDANALAVDERMLGEFVARFEPPSGEGEELVSAVSS